MAAPPPESWNVLVVDDEPNIRVLFERVLRKDGHKVMAVATGDEAIAALRKNHFDLLVTDKNLIPQLPSGVEVAHLARSRQPAICIVMVTGFASQDSADQLVGIVDEYVQKPFDIRSFTATLLQLIERRRALTAREKQDASGLGAARPPGPVARVVAVVMDETDRQHLQKASTSLGQAVQFETTLVPGMEAEALVLCAEVCSPEVHREVWRRQRTKSLPLILISDDSLDASILAVSLGASGRLVRPLRASEVESALLRLWGAVGAPEFGR